MSDPRIHIRQRFSIQDHKGNEIAHLDVIPRVDALWVDNLWVDHEHRKQGLGTALMTEMLDWYCNLDLYLEALPWTDRPMDQDQLQVWYATFGFFPTSVPGVMLRTAAAAEERTTLPAPYAVCPTCHGTGTQIYAWNTSIVSINGGPGAPLPPMPTRGMCQTCERKGWVKQ